MEIRQSAHRHGISSDDILWAIDHAISITDVDSRAAPEAMAVLYLGPDRKGRLLEVVAIDAGDGVVIHATPMRRAYRYLLPRR